MEWITLFVDVLLPLPLPGTFTYRVPRELNEDVAVGKRVIVQFGAKKLYSGIIKNIHQTAPKLQSIKYIMDVVDAEPVVLDQQFKFWSWIATYYMSTQGEVMNAALPSSMKLASETKITLHPEAEIDDQMLSEDEYLIIEALQAQTLLDISEVITILERKKVMPLIKTMIEKGYILPEEELQLRYKPKTETYVRLHRDFQTPDSLQEVMAKLESKAHKQLELVLSYLHLSQCFSGKPKEISRPALIKKANSDHSVVKALEKKGIFELYEKEHSRLLDIDAEKEVSDIQLSEEQQKACEDIKKSYEDKEICLLHGVTGSGKTEVYINLIEETLKKGEQVLFLLPEIALTSQLINRLRIYFGKQVGVYHSRFNKSERAETWSRMLGTGPDGMGEYKIILGARSAIFLPYRKLGLIIVDEEHDPSYKQYDPAPRYHARNAAIYLAYIHQAKTLLGSATPAIESFSMAKRGKYGLATLTKRFSGVQMPEVQAIDLAEAYQKREMKSHFSWALLEKMKEILEKGEQVLLFQNRRGYSLRVVCEACNWAPECKNCDVSMTYHKYLNKLKCHYCGHTAEIPKTCPACGSHKLKMKGFGTEKVEDELPTFFPDAVVKRMDLETTRSKNAYQTIINDFQDRKIDILVGTQMLSKGLDFDNVGLVGVMNADNMISFPDFRAFERTYQQLTQVSGRAGRKNNQGLVLIQTSQPYHAAIRYTMEYNYDEMYSSQMEDRKRFNYPPYYRLIRIKLRHRYAEQLNEGAEAFAKALRKQLGNRVLGPEYPMVARIKNMYIKNILIKYEVKASPSSVKDIIIENIKRMDLHDKYKSIRIDIDVDPI